MIQKVNTIYKDLFLGKYRYFVIMGGRGAGRSTAASQFALAKLIAPEYFRCAVMRQVLTDVRNSIFQDISDRAEEQGVRDSLKINDFSLNFQYGLNKINGLGFRKSSGDQKSKMKSLANYNCVIIEEADEVAEEDFMQLDDSLRTQKAEIIIVLLLNSPGKNNWIIRRWFNLLPSEIEGYYRPELKSTCTDTRFIFSTYLDNVVNLNQSTINNFENYKITRPDHYYNMIKGLVSEGMRGRVYKNWHTITDAEFEALPYALTGYLDFGFSNDPAAFGLIKKHNNKVWVRELLHQTGLINQDLADKFKTLGIDKKMVIYADEAEPKSIAELKRAGYNVVAAVKGNDSVKAGIDYLLGLDIAYTESSLNVALEVQNYCWKLDRDKEPTNDPIDDFNHQLDGIRYNLFTEHSVKKRLSGFI